MNKKFKQFMASMLMIGVVSTSVISPIFADSNMDNDSYANDSKGVTSPAKYEYTSRTNNLNKDGLWKLKTYADKANAQNTSASYVSLASYLLSLGNLSNSSTILGTISYMIQSDLDAYGTLSYAFTQYRYLDKNPGVKTVKTKIPYKRFFDGNKMNPWYPYSKPTKA